MCKNKLIIAAAGSGKTTYIAKKALEQKEGNVLITTFTENNERSIREKLIDINKCIPKNITVQTWFSFLIQHGVKPYQGYLFKKEINGLLLVNQKSGLIPNRYGKKIYFDEERNFEKFYFTNDYRIYSDKLAKFVCRCNEESDGRVINRISEIYSHIYIDEVQDLAGNDLTLLKLFFESSSSILLVGDPRQVTYQTHYESRYSQYDSGKIKNFVQEECNSLCQVDECTLNKSHRNNQIICDFASSLYKEEYEPTISNNNETTEHDGIFIIRKKNIEKYLAEYRPIQLRWNASNKKINFNYKYYNFGAAKGLEFKRVLIYPTEDMVAWLKNKEVEFEPATRTKFYVALTRARNSVAIVYDWKDNEEIEGVTKYIPEE